MFFFPFQFELPEIDCEDSRRLRNFVSYLQAEKPYCATLHVIRFVLLLFSYSLSIFTFYFFLFTTWDFSNKSLFNFREDSKQRSKFFERLIEDRTDSSLSYYEFLQHIKNQIK